MSVTAIASQSTSHDLTENLIRFAVNSSGQDKDWNFEKLATEFRDTTGTLYDLMEHILNGHALCAGNLNGDRRSKANVVGSQYILLDLDNSDVERGADGKPIKDEFGKTKKIYKSELTLEQALEHPFVKRYCSLIYTTASHTAEWHRFRLVFLLPKYIDNVEQLEEAIKFLQQQFPHDPSCKDASRVFYGSTTAEFPLVNPNVTLPADWVEKAKEQAQNKRLEAEQRFKQWEESRKSINEYSISQGWDLDVLIERALSFAPPRMPGSNNYEECTQLLMALVSHYGAAKALIIAEKWSPSIKGTTWDISKKINSYKRGGITIGTLFHIAKKYGFTFPKASGKSFGSSQFKSKSSNSSGGDGSDGNPPVIELSLRDRVIEILSRNLSESELDEAFIKLAASVNKTPQAIEKLARLVRVELEITEDRGDTQKELQKLISIKNEKLDLGDYLDSSLAEPLKEIAKWMGVPAEVFLSPLLSTAASLLSSAMRIEANKTAKFYQPFIFYMGLVCSTGAKKSPILNIFVNSLSKLQEQEEERYRIAINNYERELKEWKDSKEGDKGEPPIQPIIREFFVKNATHEALNEIRGIQKSGFVYCLDELSGLLGSYGAYKGGRGTDKESMLTGFDGNGGKQNRAGWKRFFNKHDAMSVLGATQPEKLQQQMGSMEDCQGEWARFLWILYEETLQRLPDDDDEKAVDVSDVIDKIFSQLLAISKAMPEAVFTFEKQGKILFNDYIYELDEKRLYHETRPGMKGAIAKLKGYTARLAGILYLLDCAATGNMPDNVIPTRFIEMGIKLSRYFWGQVETIYSFSGASQTELAPKLAQIIQMAQPQGRVSNRDVCKKLKITKETNLTNFRELEKMGYGTIEYKKQGFDFILNQVSPSVSSVPASVPNVGDTRKPSDSNTSSPKNSQVSPVSPVSPTSETNDSNNDEHESEARRHIPVEVKSIEKSGDTGDTGDTRSETQQQQGFGQCPQVGDTAGDTENIGDTAQIDNIYIDKECVISAGGKFDGQQGVVTGYDKKADQYQVVSEGAELWFRLEQLQILNE
jgi:hypothetical protein